MIVEIDPVVTRGCFGERESMHEVLWSWTRVGGMKKRKKKVNLFLFPSDSFDKKDKKKQDEKDVNIFDNFTKSEKNLLKKEREEKKLNKRINIDNYKFHNFLRFEGFFDEESES